MATAAPVQPDAPRRGIKALLARHPLVFYFIIAYAFSWLAEMPLVLSQDGAGLLSYRSPLGLYASIAIASFVGPIFIGVHHDGHNRREVRRGPLSAPDGAMAGGL
ncbi:MAG: hypothetical protein DMG98_22445 [Acidobacteria bacterium]|nr:MAG: hypothetical protein DMG98_22445 [Acidobacteriota bacterium]